MNIKFSVERHGSLLWKEAVKLREETLRKPLGRVFAPGELDEEKNHFHVVGLENNNLVATAVLVPEQECLKMQRVAVEAGLRDAGIGSKMISFCEEYARNKGFERVYCHARDSAVNFYLKNGYSGEGDYFSEDGIPHLKMSKAIEKGTR